jgi:magnesium transporter
LRELLVSSGDHPIRDVMERDLITVPADMDQERLSQIVSQHDLWALPVVDAENHMKGVVTIDDIVDVVQEEATEDIHKLGGQDPLDAPYLQTPLISMLRKRGGWLAVLFVGELLTASAMGYYQAELARAVLLALFIPLIISSGGNSGSQATTLVIRAMALGEVRLRDWWRIMRREIVAGLALGLILGVLGLLRVVAWEVMFQSYGPQHLLVGITVGVSLTFVVMWGTVTGSMLPFLLRSVGLDPASASAPLVATIVDVSGLAIYFTTAEIFLSGTLL